MSGPPAPASTGRDEFQRSHEYCRDFASNIYIRSAPLDELLAGSLLGYSTRQDRYYEDCMASFARIRRYTAP
ncbi:hypothetical protein [Falsiroseomonas sp.]|uniref:hypothetical protein n=1 Tax=Falsiroseomonas sp. TaxID=2870721 RepID=UPI00273484C2|nr:hypothetical protein [Falsiroseomonas sp.]MDP3417848.1 hypothetical protein [Falsiroseomonas sp.]